MSHTLGPFKSNPLKEKVEVLEKISEIEFHDLPVNWFKIQFEPENALIIQITPYAEELKEYEIINIKFKQILNFQTNGYDFNREGNLEIGSLDYEWNENFNGKLFLLIGRNQGCIEIKFECESLELEYLGLENETNTAT